MQEAAIGKQVITMSARVYRAHPKPAYIPFSIWQSLIKKQSVLAGHWENLGQIATSEDGSISLIKK